MDSDVDVWRWVLELLLRDRENESIAKRVLAVAPFAKQDWRLKKTVLLRTIECQIYDCASVTETILEMLESIEVLDRGQGFPTTNSMRAAYCAVATECTVKFLVCLRGEPSGKYMEAVDRIWRGRVRVLEESERSELVSSELKERRDEVEAGIWDMIVSKKLSRMNTRNDALRLVAAYVKEAFARMGPPFIITVMRLNMAKESFGSESDQDAVENGGNVGDRCEMEVQIANGADLGDVTGLEVAIANRGVLSFEPATKEKEISRNKALKRKHGPVKIRDAENVGTDTSDGIHHYVSSAEVRKVQEELKSRVMTLQALVTDPLPYALHVSGIVRSELEMRSLNHVSGEVGAANSSVEKNTEPDHSNNGNHGNLISSHRNDVPQPAGKENDAPNLFVDKAKGTEYVQSGDLNLGDPCCSNQNRVSRPGFVERNSNAHTYEWDDSLGMSPEGTMNGKGRLHLPSPKRNAVSPLKKYEDKRFAKRRKVKRWSLHEEDTLRTGVQKYGKGNWKFILDMYRDIFEERTEVDLKDKWRNMTK
ncbi:hypothetical protein M0R45_012674 [Rubus argutus]|uniref:Uncharacterized protein n=1 Tax=Rubus argutus TaxID=59490 RepID=A0AAW1YEW1_RUBAR